ncbi:MAG: hypothetical protein ACD_2C00233G0012 [uncultured bacterium (gcode 4)]|uniref:Uncharacterized protein n=1 Tax=uncultured bacterium (gcode 4) TaxID=1234023 RepID=K2GFL0_9BACT|nr:MAG: hypothetical protein ACD_2C00233G0012 [uncultured bacterium (gcode 4)]
MSISYFDEIFFERFIKQREDEILDICHRHIITITDTIVVWLFFWVILPAFFYYNNSFASQDAIPFIFFEWYLFAVYCVLIYKIFDWYNDVWIITDKWIIDLDWQYLKTNITYIDYSDVKWIWVVQNSAWDWLLNKWEIEIHTMWDWWWSFWLSDAKSPGDIVWYIQWILEDREKKKKEKDVTFNDKFFNTIKWVIKDYLEREGLQQIDGSDDDDVESPEEIAAAKALKKKWTIDLRNNAE